VMMYSCSTSCSLVPVLGGGDWHLRFWLSVLAFALSDGGGWHLAFGVLVSALSVGIGG